jgi:hypothetical protein
LTTSIIQYHISTGTGSATDSQQKPNSPESFSFYVNCEFGYLIGFLDALSWGDTGCFNHYISWCDRQQVLSTEMHQTLWREFCRGFSNPAGPQGRMTVTTDGYETIVTKGLSPGNPETPTPG